MPSCNTIYVFDLYLSSRKSLFRADHYLDVLIFIVNQLHKTFLNNVLNRYSARDHFLVTFESAYRTGKPCMTTAESVLGAVLIPHLLTSIALLLQTLHLRI